MKLKQIPTPVWQLSFALVAMVIIGVCSRLELTGMPNVKPVAAMALWAAFCFRSFWLPSLAILIVMGTTDLVLGSYAWPILVSVYASLIVACWLGVQVRNRLEKKRQQASLPSTAAGMMAASLMMSTTFFVLTNGMVWAMGWYPPTLVGLLECYVAGIPFYRFTLLGDLAFTAGGLVVWQLVAQLSKATPSNSPIGVQV